MHTLQTFDTHYRYSVYILLTDIYAHFRHSMLIFQTDIHAHFTDIVCTFWGHPTQFPDQQLWTFYINSIHILQTDILCHLTDIPCTFYRHSVYISLIFCVHFTQTHVLCIFTGWAAHLCRWVKSLTWTLRVVYCWTRIHSTERTLFRKPVPPGSQRRQGET